MATSYDNLATRNGSPVYSIRSGSATGSVNVSETRDLSRQSEQQARIQHRKAIQVRKVAFLVIVLFLLIGGLSYAIYRVVSNKSDENETEKMKLDIINKITSINGIPRSSVSDMLDKSVNISPEASEIMVRSTSVKQPFMSNMSTMQREYQSSSNQTRSVVSSLTPSLSEDVGATPYSSAKSPQSVSQPDTMTLAKSSHSKHDQSSKIPNDRVVQSMSTHTPILYASIPKNTEILLSATSSPWKHKTSTIKESGVSWSKQTESIAQNMQTASPTTSSKHSQNVFYSPSSEVLPLSLFEKSLYSEIASTQSIKIDETTSSSSTQKLLHSEVVPTQSNTASSFFTPSVSSRDEQTSSSAISNQRVYQSSTLLSSVSTLINELELTTTKSLSAFTGKDEAPSSTLSVVQQTENSTLLSTSTTTRLNTTTATILVDSSKTVQSVFPSPIAKIANTSSTVLMTSSIPTSLLLATLALDTSIIINKTTTGSVGQNSMTYSLEGQMTNNSISPSKTFVTPIASSSIPVVPYYHEWGNWSDCSLNCGGGFKHRTRQCSHDGECTDLGPKINISACNMQKCNETIFSVSLNATDYQWTDDYYNTSSTAYIALVNRLKRELQLLYGPNVSVTIDNISQGSVIMSFTLTLSTTETIEKLTNTFGDGKLGNLSISLVKLINNMVPGEPSFLTTQNTTTNSTMVHWSSLNGTNGMLLGYKILITPGNITLDIRNPLETSYEVTNLTHDTSYTVQLLGYNINGDGVKTITTFKTNDLPPFYLPWGSWSNCSRDCGGGLTRRDRNCSKEGLCSHLGEAEQIEHCNVYKCNETSYSVKLNVTNVKWTDDLYNKSSKAYKEMLQKLIAELRKKYPNATFSLGDISHGSIIFNIKITFPGEEAPDTETVANGLKSGIGNYTVEVKDVENDNVPRQPPGFINVTMTTHHSTTVKWLAISEGDSNGAVLEYFIVLYLSENKTTEFNVSAKASDTEFNYLLSKLAPNTTYRFYMYGKNINGKGVDSNLIYFTTKVQIPKITSRNVSQITINHAVLYWSRIADNNASYGIISGYKIVLSGEYDLQVSAEEARANLTNLLPNTTYTVTVFGYNDYGHGVVSNASFTTMVQIPKITSRNVSQITINHAVLYWSRIADNNASYGIISGYKIVLSGEYDLQVSAEEARANLTNLLPNTTYTVTVLGYNDYGDGVVSNTSFTTMVQIPKITSRNVSQIAINHAVLYWSRVADNNASYGIISGYKIVLSGEYDLQVSAEEAKANLTNLLPDTTYTVTVLGYNDYGDGVVSNTSFTTMVQIPKITSRNVSQITINHAVLYWSRIADNNASYGIISGYKIVLSGEYGLQVSAEEAKANLTNLLPNTTYTVTVLGCNDYGDGVVSNTSFTTMVQIPKITSRNVSQITINHAVLYWSRIADNNASYGIISGYKIVLSGEYDLQVSAEEARANLTNLLPNTTYTVTVLGYNDYGDGVVSNASFTTMALIPKPMFVIVTNTTSNTAILKWEKIPSNEKYGKIHGYRILIINGSFLSSIHTIINVSQVVLQNLSSNKTYRVQILGFNQYGDGLMSDVYSFTTLVMLRMAYSSASQTKSSNTIGLKESQSSKSSLMTSYEFESASFYQMVSHSSSSKFSSQSMPFGLPYSSSAVPSYHSLVIQSTYAHSSTHGHAPSTSAVPVAFSVTPSSAVIPTTKSCSPEPQAPTNETQYIVGKIRLVDESFSSDLNNPEADKFKALARQLEQLLHALFKANGLVFEKVVVIGFSEGSIYVKFFVLVDTVNNYQEENVTTILANASRNGGLGDKPFEIKNEDFHTENNEPTPEPTTNEGNKGLQKNDDDDDSALVVAIVMIVLLACGMACVVVYIGKKRNWFKRGKRKVVPDDDDDDDDDMYPQPDNDKMRLKTARGPRKTRGQIINAGQSTTEC